MNAWTMHTVKAPVVERLVDQCGSGSTYICAVIVARQCKVQGWLGWPTPDLVHRWPVQRCASVMLPTSGFCHFSRFVAEEFTSAQWGAPTKNILTEKGSAT